MFQWKQFHIDPQYLLLDDTRLPRPFYVSPSHWIDWCEGLQDGRTYQDGYDDCEEKNSHLEYEEKDLEKAEEKGYESAIADIRDDIIQFISYDLETLEAFDEATLDALSDKLRDIVGL